MTPGVPGHPVLFVQLVDAFGVSYQVEAGAFTADGRPHPLTVPLAARRGAAYPLRITGFALQYVMPKRQSGLAHLVIGPVRAAAAMTGAAGESFAPGRPGEPLVKLVSMGDPTSQGRLVASPAILTVPASPAGLTINFDTGAGYGPPSRDCGQPHNLYPCGPPSTLPATLTVLAVSRPGSLPAVVTSNFAKAMGTGAGRSFPVSYAGTTINLKVVSVISGFPTITGPAGGAIVDQASLQDALASAGALPAQVTEWWLRTSRPVALAGLPAGTTITDRAVMAASLLASPLAAAPQLAMLAIAAAAVILAVAGFFVSAATARERAHDMALLAALGATKGQLTRLLCLEQAVISVPAALAGLLLGGLLARLVIPAVSITAAGTPPVPPVLVQTPWAVPCAVALVMAAGPVLLAAAGGGPRSRAVRHTRVEATT